MAVEDKYINADVVAGKLANAALSGEGNKLVCMTETFEVAAADSDASVYRVFKNVNANLIPVKIEIYNDAITAGSDYDLGFYQTNLGAVVDADKLADGLDMSTGATRAYSSLKNGLITVGIDEVEERIFELAGHTATTKLPGYDIAFTANTVGSGAGTITIVAWFVQG